MITLYHCAAARSFRPLWTLEELGLPYELKMLPFPPRVFAKEYLGINPLGTIPLLLDGETRMTESAGIAQYLVSRYGPTPLAVAVDEPDYGAFINWLHFGEATLTFPQTLVLRYTWKPRPPKAKRSAPAASPRRTFPSATRYCWRRGSALPRILVRRLRPIGSDCRCVMAFAGRSKPRIWPAISKTSPGGSNLRPAACSAAAG